MSHDSPPTPNRPGDELLSAWIDGELSDAERKQVEAHLAENSAAKRLLKEYQEISDTLRKLPRQSVDARFQESVMKAIDAAGERGGGIQEVAPFPPGSAEMLGGSPGRLWPSPPP